MFVDSINDSYFDSTVRYEIVESSSQYEIAESSYYQHFNVYIYLVQDRYTGKYNMYVLDTCVKKWPHYLSFIVDYCKPLSLDFALFCFPQYGLNEETYGF